MARIPLIESRKSLEPEHRDTYDAIAASRGAVRGCFPALLHVPAIADHTASLGGNLRFDGKIESKVRALAALTVARESECVHEWAAGVRNAEKNHISREALSAIHQRQTKLKSSTTCAPCCSATASRNRCFNRCSSA